MKQIMKRLLGIMLVIAVVIGVLPMSGVTVQAAAISRGTRIYFDTNSVENFKKDGAVPSVLFKDGENSSNGTWVLMTLVSGSSTVYYADADRDNVTHVQFRRSSSGNVDWNSGTSILALQAGMNCYKISSWNATYNYWQNSGTWSEYSETSGGDSGEGSSSGYTVYFDTSGNENANWNSSPIYVYGFMDSGNSGIQPMKSAGSNLYSYTFEKQYESVIFLNANSFPDADNSDKSSQTTDQQVPWSYENPTFTLTGEYDANGGKKKGIWSNGSGASETTTGYFNVDATLVDYYNDERVNDPSNLTANQGLQTGSGHRPYGNLNSWISGLASYSNPDTRSDNPVPLYFGDLFQESQAGTTDNKLTWYWKGANVAFHNDGNAVARGIVAPRLSDSGQLLASYGTTENPILMPFFEENAYQNQSTYMKFYKNLEFPFTATTTNGVTKYSFDSEKNTVYYDYKTGKLVRDDNLKIYDWGSMNLGEAVHAQRNAVGYFPFNNVGNESGGNDSLNFGFGTKFTIPFTVSAEGKDINNQDITFNFTGDDDVWVYIDGALVLDMGGGHYKASGNINFAKKTATVTSGSSEARIGNELSAGGNIDGIITEPYTVSFEDIQVKLPNDGGLVSLADYIKKDNTVHTLTMYYMERGMWNSNMSIDFTFSPVPSGLVVSKDVANVNKGLADIVENKDEFNFDVVAKKDNSEVSFSQYTLTDHNSQSTKKSTNTNTIEGIRADRYANNFLDADGNDAFIAGTEFTITENVSSNKTFNYDTSKTEWKVYDADNNYSLIENGTGGGSSAQFTLGTAEDDATLKSYNYSVNFINHLKTGNLSIKKVYENAEAGETFEFTMQLDLDGNGSEFTPQTYANLVYTSSKTDNEGNAIKGTTDSEGKISIEAGETVTFSGIPAEATYEITETAPADANWKIQNEENTKGTIKDNATSEAVVTNVTKGALLLEADKIVMDYGKNIQVDILANDGEEFVSADYITETSDYAKVSDNDYRYKVGDTWTAEVVGFVNSADTKLSDCQKTAETSNAKYSIASNKKVEVELSGFLSEVDTVYCVVKVTSTSNNEKYFINELNVIPATSMYYEDSFSSFHYIGPSEEEGAMDSNSLWQTTSSTGEDSLQNDGTVGSNAPYGADSSYNDDLKYSNGSAHQILVPAGSLIGGYNKTYIEFNFKGKGFDLISSTGVDAATIKAEIYKVSDLSIIKNATVNNVGASELNQIPVLSCEGLEYGEYHVKIQVFAAYNNDSYPALKRGSEFIFDGLRIYDPLDTSDAVKAAIALDAYKADKEAFVERLEIRDLIIGAEDFDSLTEGTDGDGVVYIDATSTQPTTKNENAKVADYKVAGPNNETYLQNYNGVVFILKVSSIPKSIQVGAKSINGAETAMEVSITKPGTEDSDEIQEAWLYQTMKQATAQNYSTFEDSESKIITDFAPYFVSDGDGYYAYVTISCVAPDDNSSVATLSITDIKATFETESTMKPMYNIQMANDLGIESGDENEVVTDEELKLYSADFTTESVRYTKQATLTVVTSANVEEVVVENESGNVVSAAISSLVNDEGQIVWTLKFKPGAVGTRTFSVYGKDVDGNKTTIQSVSIEATRR